MADYAPPTGPPPPKVPAGWKAVWNNEYSEWFFVNIYTKKSQWDKPTEPVYGDSDAAPSHPPPSYASHPNPASLGPEKTSAGTLSSDEAYARRLQAEENARSSAGPGHYDNRAGASDDYYRQSQGTGVVPGPAPPLGGGQYNQSMPVNESKSKGLLGKLMGGGHSQPHPQAQYAPQQGYYQQQGGYPQQGGYGGGGMMPGMGGGMMGGGMMGQPPRRTGGGMGMGGAALGLGGGLLGGMLIGDMIGDAGDGGGDGGGDYGGGGGDYGGGDGGGGDFGGGDGGGGDF